MFSTPHLGPLRWSKGRGERGDSTYTQDGNFAAFTGPARCEADYQRASVRFARTVRGRARGDVP